MRGGKTKAVRRQTLTILLRELKTPHITWRLGDDYRLQIAVYDEREADEFRKLLFTEIGFSRVREKINVTAHCHLIEVTWNEYERDYLIKNIEEYLQEDNMGPTNINRQNTKFYAIVTDENGKKTAYEITHTSLKTKMEYCFGESNVTHTLEFEQGDMLECKCGLAEYVKQKDELEKLKARLGNCKNQLRNACGFLSGITAAGLDKVNNIKLTPTIDIYDMIKDVKFANPATIVFWKDGTKTVVKTQGDEEYIPEVGLAMCICKKVMGNTRDYYRVFKHWMKKV